MCGLVGVLSSEMDAKKIQIFQGLMVVGTLRGTIGAGIAFVPKKPGSVHLLRHQTLTAAELAYDGGFSKHVKDTKDGFSCLIGHARAPTSGGFELSDIHPHVSRHIIGTHNGHMSHVSGKKVPKRANDSSVLFEAIGNQGIEPVLQNSTGAYSIVVFNKQTQRLTFARNKHRPMHFCMTDDDPKTLYWASEAQMLQLVVGRSVSEGVKLHHYTLPADEMISFPVFESSGIRFEDRKTIAKATSVPSVPKTSDTPTDDKTADNDNITRLFTFSTVHGTYLSKTELSNVLHAGCANCEESATFEDYTNKKTLFFSPKEFICETCLIHDQTARDYVTAHGIILPHGLPAIPRVQ